MNDVFSGLMALALFLLAAAHGLFLTRHYFRRRLDVRTLLRRAFWRNLWCSELGAAVVATNYYARSGLPGGTVLINGSATPPTAIQAQSISVLKVLMVMPAAIVQGTITHNWGLDKSSPTYYDPEIFYEVNLLSDAGSGSYVPLLSFDRTNTNYVLVNRLAGVGAFANAVTFLITLRNNAAILAAAGSAS